MSNFTQKIYCGLDFIKFLIRQRVLGFNISHTPHFEDIETVHWFMSRLKNSQAYLEYGSGGSTYLAAQYQIPFIAIDSDKYFLNAVELEITKANLLDRQFQTFLHRDIGLTGAWGVPVTWNGSICLDKLSEKRERKLRSYSDPPLLVKSGQFSPDLVLIDGRFRVACVLKLLSFLHRDALVVVDDYVDRPHYHVIESFLYSKELVGRMAIFKNVVDLDLEQLRSMIGQYELDLR